MSYSTEWNQWNYRRLVNCLFCLRGLFWFSDGCPTALCILIKPKLICNWTKRRALTRNQYILFRSNDRHFLVLELCTAYLLYLAEKQLCLELPEKSLYTYISQLQRVKPVCMSLLVSRYSDSPLGPTFSNCVPPLSSKIAFRKLYFILEKKAQVVGNWIWKTAPTNKDFCML